MKKYIIKIFLIFFIIITIFYLTNCFLEKYTITFDAQGGNNVEDINSRPNSTIELPIPTKEGYTFLGWYLNNTLYEETIMPSENITLVAKWELITCRITFDAQGGNNVEDINSRPNSTIELPIPTKEGYTFLSWYLNNTLYEETTMPSENITLVAKWEAITCSLTFDENGGSDVEDIINIYGTQITLPIPARKYYNFLGWYLNDNLYEETTLCEKNITLTAKWEKKEPISKYGTYEYFCELDGVDYELMDKWCGVFSNAYETMAELTILSEKKECEKQNVTMYYGYQYKSATTRECYLVNVKINELYLGDIRLLPSKLFYNYGDKYFYLFENLVKESELTFKYAIPVELFDDVMKYKTLFAKINISFSTIGFTPDYVFDELVNLNMDSDELKYLIEYDQYVDNRMVSIPPNCILFTDNLSDNKLEYDASWDMKEWYIFGVDGNVIKPIVEEYSLDYYFEKYKQYLYYNLPDNPTYLQFKEYIEEILKRNFWRELSAIANRYSEDRFTEVPYFGFR